VTVKSKGWPFYSGSVAIFHVLKLTQTLTSWWLFSWTHCGERQESILTSV